MSLNGVQGIWDTDQVGGWIYGPCYTTGEAETALVDMQNEYLLGDADPGALEIREYCPDHYPQDQPKDDCRYCKNGIDPEFDDEEEEW